ncbi:Transcription factor VOZ1 [Platanthera guangdongensis]|uniref:Transcription factor VOZ1 n=1 Tax=Platanthera guangdongensis TaxID=2320717 RepID=A0ABR2MNQ6_9ASPA
MVRSCSSASHRQLKEKARGRVGELQGVFADLQLARKESRAADVIFLEEHIHRVLGEWKVELSDASPASSLIGNCVASPDLSSEVQRMLQLYEEEDATSNLAELEQLSNSKPEIGEELKHKAQGIQNGGNFTLQEDFNATEMFPGLELPIVELDHDVQNCLEVPSYLNFRHFSLHQVLPHNAFLYLDSVQQTGLEVFSPITEFVPTACPPPSASMRPKCALWDCPRPADVSDWYHEYCSSFHASLAFNEGPPGMTPVLRPGGINLKDGPLFAALSAKTRGKNVGIPECRGAATAKSPWNAPELFDLIVLRGESLREWLFFDKPRRAFESGNRKQRSLPDYNGRGWHESRKQVMKEFGGLKRSYYMDPQPLCHYEWHLYEYEINGSDSCSLFRLELKLVDAKRAKGKVTSDSLADLQQQMRRLNSESSVDGKRLFSSRNKINQTDAADSTNNTDEGRKTSRPFQAMNPMGEKLIYGSNISFGCSVDALDDFYGA